MPKGSATNSGRWTNSVSGARSSIRTESAARSRRASRASIAAIPPPAMTTSSCRGGFGFRAIRMVPLRSPHMVCRSQLDIGGNEVENLLAASCSSSSLVTRASCLRCRLAKRPTARGVSERRRNATMLTRRQLLARGAVGAGMLAMPGTVARAVPAATAPRFTKLPRFTVPLPIPATATPASANTYHITQRQTQQTLHPRLDQTTVWGYDDGTLGPLYPGPTIEVQKGTPTTVMFENQLPTSHLLPLDTRIVPGEDATVRALTHLHGGFVSGADDGNPYETEFAEEYRRGETQTVTYPNDQPATTLWYHDHAVSITRLNVYPGLAAYYLIRDGDDTGAEPNPIGIPGGEYEIPIVIQDRSFYRDGELFYPGPEWEPEFFGDTAVVNGAPFPFLKVEPRKYRFRFLNGSNSRFYNLRIEDGPNFHHIGSEGGMFAKPVEKRKILILPAERSDVIVDFAGYEGKKLVLRNARLPDGVVSPAEPRLPLIMEFRVGTTVKNPGPSTIPKELPGALPHF